MINCWISWRRQRIVSEATTTVVVVLLAYLDEAYDNGEYWMTALVCPCEQVINLQTALDRVVTDASHRFPGIVPQAELHGHALMQGQDDWVDLARKVRASVGIYSRALEAIAAVPGVQVIFRGLDRKRHAARYPNPRHPHMETLKHALQSLDDFGSDTDRPVLVIADEVGDHDTHRTNFWSYQHYASGGYFHGKLNHLADTLHFAPSKHSRLLQAADMVSYIHYRKWRQTMAHPKAVKAADDLYALVKPMIRYRYLWLP